MSSDTPARGALPTPADGSGRMFDRVAARYDVLNRLMSLGLDGGWRRHLVGALRLPPAPRVLDVATGTADVALTLCRALPDVSVTGLDPSPAMLDLGRRKVAAAGFADRIELTAGDAQALPFASASFDGISIAFGIRNVPDRAAALREMVRVCRPGRRLAVLELTEPRRGPGAWLARLHVHLVVPALGALLSSRNEYRYLQASIAAFPPPAAFCDMLRAAGLAQVHAQPLCFGAVHLFWGEVPA